MEDHHGIAKQIQEKRFREMAPSEKLRASLQLYFSARQLKAAWFRSQHPNWNEQQVQHAVREAFLYARS